MHDAPTEALEPNTVILRFVQLLEWSDIRLHTRFLPCLKAAIVRRIDRITLHAFLHEATISVNEKRACATAVATLNQCSITYGLMPRDMAAVRRLGAMVDAISRLVSTDDVDEAADALEALNTLTAEQRRADPT
jgi:hypothetical protein